MGEIQALQGRQGAHPPGGYMTTDTTLTWKHEQPFQTHHRNEKDKRQTWTTPRRGLVADGVWAVDYRLPPPLDSHGKKGAWKLTHVPSGHCLGGSYRTLPMAKEVAERITARVGIEAVRDIDPTAPSKEFRAAVEAVGAELSLELIKMKKPDGGGP